MRCLIYDGTPMGLINAMAVALDGAAALDDPPLVEFIPQEHFRPRLFGEVRWIETDYAAAGAFLRELAARLPSAVWREVLVSFFTGEPEAGTTLHTYLRLLFRTGGKAAEDWTDDLVRRVHQLSGRVQHEIQRLHGFIRFQRLPNDLYYAQVTPDHPILPLLAPHFAARFADQQWLIHDSRRNNGIYYDGNRWVFLPAVTFPTAPDAALAARLADEDLCQSIWREYFHQIAVTERTNPRLQRQRLPRRYWGNMTEMQKREEPDPPA